jgi:hypothetical protein
MNYTMNSTAAMVIAMMALAGCGPEKGPGPSRDAGAHWTVRINTSPAGTIISPDDPRKGPEAWEGDPDSVTVSGGAICIRSLRLALGAAVDTSITAEDQTRDSRDGSIRFQGPYVVTASSTGDNLGTEDVASGVFDRVLFVLEPAGPGDVSDQTTEMVGQSILIAGRIWRDGLSNGFVYGSTYSSEFAVIGSFALGGGQSGEGRLVFNAAHWFRNGERWLDPGEAQNNGTILHNIRRNISAEWEVSEL